MRCQVCDYGVHTESLYHEALALKHRWKRVRYSKKYKKYLCSDCSEKVIYPDDPVKFNEFGDLIDTNYEDILRSTYTLPESDL